jgi:predicted porin
MSLGALTRVRFWNGALFDERWLYLYGEYTARPGLSMGMYYRHGTQLDLTASRTGTVDHWEPWVTLDVGRGINLNLNYTGQRLRRDGGTAFRTHVVDGRFSWQLDPRQRLRLSVQGSDVERDPALYDRPVRRKGRDIAAQLLYSYKLNPRSALYAGYSHGGYSDDVQTTLADSTRSLFLKLGYAWQP